MNFIIGTLLYLWPRGSANTTQTGGQTRNATNRRIVLKAFQFRLPCHNSWRYRCTTVCAITSFCSFSISTSKNSTFLRSIEVRILPAESAPAAKASSSVAIVSHCLPAAIKSLARSFSFSDSFT